MLTRVNKVLIGKDIDRDAQVVAGATLATITLSTGLADGEVVILDKYKKVLAAGATVANTDILYVCQGTGTTFNYTNEAGTAVTGARKVIFSDPIQGSKVRSFKGRPFVAKVEKTASVDLTGLTPVAGTEYLIRVIYKDMEEYPSQFTQTYRHIATAADAAAIDVFGAALAAKVNAHSGRRVSATYTAATDVLLLTALEIPECCSALTNLEEFRMVDFEARFLYIDSDGYWQIMPSTVATITNAGPTPGSGNWEQVRDLEKEQLPYVGISNFTQFPVITPTMATVVDEEYNLIVIEHDKEYLSPGINSYQSTQLTTVIALPVAALQELNILACLNPWMASCPGKFSAVAF
jgi:hypothetical protein